VRGICLSAQEIVHLSTAIFRKYPSQPWYICSIYIFVCNLPIVKHYRTLWTVPFSRYRGSTSICYVKQWLKYSEWIWRFETTDISYCEGYLPFSSGNCSSLDWYFSKIPLPTMIYLFNIYICNIFPSLQWSNQILFYRSITITPVMWPTFWTVIQVIHVNFARYFLKAFINKSCLGVHLSFLF
jgi:hypothetical protein